MNYQPYLAFITLVIATSSIGAQTTTLPQKRTITDSAGRSMEVTVLAVTEDAMRIKRASDGKEFEMPLGKLSDQDKKYAERISGKSNSDNAFDKSTSALGENENLNKIDANSILPKYAQEYESIMHQYYYSKYEHRNISRVVDIWRKRIPPTPYSNRTNLKDSNGLSLEAVELEMQYEKGFIKAFYQDIPFQLRIFGPDVSDKAIVIFESHFQSGMKPYFYGRLNEFVPIIQNGWSIIHVTYPRSDRFRSTFSPYNHKEFFNINPHERLYITNDSIRFMEKVENHFSGFVASVVLAIRKENKFTNLHLVGDSLGAAVIAWDMEKIQMAKNITVTMISPPEHLMPSKEHMNKISKLEIISMPKDPYVTDPEYRKWLDSRAAPRETFGELPDYHLRMPHDISYKTIVDYLLKKLK